MAYNRRHRPRRHAYTESLAARAREAYDAILGGDEDGIPVYRTPSQNLIMVVSLAGTIQIDPDHPAAGIFQRALTLMKTVVVHKDKDISAHNILASESY